MPAARSLLLPQHVGIPLPVDVRERSALRRSRAAIKPLPVRGPIKTGEVRPTFHCKLPVRLTRERKQVNVNLGLALSGKRDGSAIGRARLPEGIRGVDLCDPEHL